jgi:hypothetical protein
MKRKQAFGILAVLAIGLTGVLCSPARGAEPLVLDLSKVQGEKLSGGGGTNQNWQSIVGRQTFDGLPFAVEAHGYVYGAKLGAEKREGVLTYPDLVAIQVGRKFEELHVLHAAKGADLEGQEIARIRLNYADGSRQEFPILFGAQVRDWQRLATEEKELLTDPNTKIVWRSAAETGAKAHLRLFKTLLVNPHPDKAVATIDITSSRHRAAYDLLAATVADHDAGRPLTPPRASDEPERHFDGRLTVKLTEESSDKPIAGALVDPSFKLEDGFQDGIPLLTSASGDAVVRFPSERVARIAVTVNKEGYGSDRVVAKLDGRTSKNLRVKLASSQTLTGIVRNSSGAPVEGALVVAWPDWRTRSKTATTDSAGRFTLLWHPQKAENSDSEILLIARDQKHNLAVAQPVEDSATNAELHLKPGLTLAGRVTDVERRPLTNATADLILIVDRRGGPLGKAMSCEADGRFEMKALPTGLQYSVGITAKGYGSARHGTDTEAQGPRIELEAFTLAPAIQRVAGVVVDANERPVTNATVYGMGEGQPRLTEKTDKKGHFTFTTVCDGQLTLQAQTPNGKSGSAQAQAGDTNITIQIAFQDNEGPRQKATKISGVVTDPDGKPAADVRVSLFPSFSSGEKKTDSLGRFTLTFDPNQMGPMSESPPLVIARDIARNLAAAVELEEGATNAAVRLEPALIIAGRVTDRDGITITNAQARLIFHTERMGMGFGQPVRAGADGRFEIKGLPLGRRYTVSASAKGFGQEQRGVGDTDSQTNRVELAPFQLARANLRIAGVVLDADDQPVPRASLYTHGERQPNLNVQTDAKGQFVLDKVCAGAIQISANTRNGGYAQVTAEGGDTNVVIRVSASRFVQTSEPQAARLKGKPLPDLAALGLTPAMTPGDQPVLALLIDAEQRPSRRALRLLSEQAAALKEKGVAVVVVQAGGMAEDAFKAWKQEAALPFPIGCLPGNPEKARVAWGAGALPWLILTDKAHRVAAEGFAVEELEASLKDVTK